MSTHTQGLLAGRYRKVATVGIGGMARVFLAEDERLGRRVAVKQLHAESPAEAAERFEREAKLGASLNHPNLVSIYDIATDEESVLIVMEYVEGRTLKDAVADGPLSVPRVVSIVHDVAAALNHAHSHGIVHRDVKPANILIRDDGVTKLADLGIATAAESTSITKSGMVLGTASYMAPEQLDGQKAGPAADIYALAAVAFEAVSGRKALTGETPMEIAHRVVSSPPPDLREAWPEAPAAAAEALRRGMARRPEDRPSSAGELATALQRGLRAPAAAVASVDAGKGSAAAPAAGIAAGTAAARDAGAAEASPEGASSPEATPASPTAPEATPAKAPEHSPASAKAPEATPPSERPPVVTPPRARREEAPPPNKPPPHAGAGRGGDAPERRTYPRRGRVPSWLPAAAALAALCALAIVAFSVLGGDDDPPGDSRSGKASQSESADSKASGSDDGSSAKEAGESQASDSGSGSSTGSGAGADSGAGSGSSPVSGSPSSSGGTSSGAGPAALNSQGFRLMNQGRYDEAIPLLQKAVAAYPNGSSELTYAFALYNLGRSLRLAGRPREAVPILERRLRIPNQTETVRRELEAARRAAG